MSSVPREEPLPKRRKIEFASNAKPLASFSPSQRVSSRQSKSTPVKAPTNGNPQRKLSRPTNNKGPRKDQKECQEVIDLTANEPDAKDVNDTGIIDEKPVAASSASGSTIQSIPSPFRLLKIKDLPTNDNMDTVGIQDILGDPMLKQVWLFNYMHNIPWVMSQFDPDIRPHLKVNFVHGWKNEDPSRIQMEVFICFLSR
jgi:tyrosyl-DNA phosphodiesterase-1